MNPYEATPTAAPLQGYDPDAVQMQNRRIRSVAYNQAMQDRVKAQTGSYGNYTNPESLASSYQAQMGYAPTPARAAAVRDPFGAAPQQAPTEPAVPAPPSQQASDPLGTSTTPLTLNSIVERRNRAAVAPEAASPQTSGMPDRNAEIAGNLARSQYGQRPAAPVVNSPPGYTDPKPLGPYNPLKQATETRYNRARQYEAPNTSGFGTAPTSSPGARRPSMPPGGMRNNGVINWPQAGKAL